VCQGDLARVGQVSAADQPGVGDSVVRGAKRAIADQGHVWWELVGDLVNAGHVQGSIDMPGRIPGIARARSVLLVLGGHTIY